MNLVSPKIRFIRHDDIEQVAALHKDLDFSGWNNRQWSQAVEYYPCCWVLESDSNRITGYIAYQTRSPQVELLNLGIARELQNQGMGYSFLKATLSLLPPISENVYLEVRRSNIPAIGLYEKLGFRKAGHRPSYYSVAGGAKEDALIYRLDIAK